MFEITVSILRSRGEDVDVWVVRNKDYLQGFRGRVAAFFSGIYSLSMKREMRKKLSQNRPDIVHAHNLYPIMSASVLVACKEANVPVVIHCHSHFLTCPIGTHLRRGSICEKCTRHSPLFGIVHNCRESIVQSVAYALRAQVTRWRGWFRKDVTRIILLSNFARERLSGLNYPKERLVVLPNVVNIPDQINKNPAAGKYVVYVGRISSEKGIILLIKAAEKLPKIEFRIAGDGPLRLELEQIAPQNVFFEGWLDEAQISKLYQGARLAVIPSICYETFGLSAADAMIHGLPVVASRLGGLAEVAEEGVSGLFFQAGNLNDLAEKIELLWHDQNKLAEMGKAAYSKAHDRYRESIYYKELKTIYSSAIEEHDEVSS